VSNNGNVSRGCGFEITQLGREDRRQLPTCDCRPVIDGGLYVCHDCGTVWGVLRGRLYTGYTRIKTSTD
jgi:hypothetical protein